MKNNKQIHTILEDIEKIVINENLGDNIVTDGIINQDKWKETNPKIVFVLKETNDQETPLTKLLNNPFSGDYHCDNESEEDGNARIIGNLRTTWLNIARWTFGIMSLSEDEKIIPWKEIESGSDWYKEGYKDGQKSGWLKDLENIAVINIKKTQGKAKSNENELIEAIKQYGSLTWKQITYYKPKIVIFCGVGWLFDTYYLNEEWKKTVTGYKYFENKNTVYIQFWHPNAHFPNNMMFYALMNIVKELQKNYKIG